MDDAEPMFRNWASDPEVTKYLTWPTHKNVDISREVIKNWLSAYESERKYEWAIELKSLHEPIGSISAVKVEDNTNLVHMGYCIGRPWWHKGYTSEALTRLVRFFFEEVGANRIEACFDPRNRNSGKVMAKAGLKYEGTMRQANRNNQGICDAAYYAILADDYFGKGQKRGITIGDISIDCADPARTRDFYAALTGWEKREAYGCPALVGDNGLWTICPPLLMKPSDSVQPKPQSNLAANISLRCSTQRDIRFVCAPSERADWYLVETVTTVICAKLYLYNAYRASVITRFLFYKQLSCRTRGHIDGKKSGSLLHLAHMQEIRVDFIAF
jgi:ribosomal-protein-alanine N-acetyltransferase